MQNGVYILKNATPDSESAIRAQRIVQSQLDHMGRLIEDLLDVARVNSGKVRLKCESVDLRKVLTNITEAGQIFLESAGHNFVMELPDEPLIVDVDASRMHQIFTNLLSNAAKYTPSGGQITLKAWKNEDEVVVQIVDDGIGIPIDAQARVFNMFEQISRHTSQAQGGLGIGLALVQRLVTLHNGRVEAFSAGPNLGSTFTVHLPLSRSQSAISISPQLSTSRNDS
jgi:signal transduction histidine kinase